MKRESIIALTVAGVLGATGGTALALQRLGGAPTSAGVAAATTPPLFYATKTSIRDGEKTLTLDPGTEGIRGEPVELRRLGDGYVLSTHTEAGRLTFPVYHVKPDGSMRELGETDGTVSVSADHEFLAFRDRGTGGISVYDAAGRRTAGRPLADPQPDLTWLGSQLLINTNADKSGIVPLLRWDPQSGRTFRTLKDSFTEPSSGIARMTVSPDQRRIAGKRSPDGSDSSDFADCTNLSSVTPQETGRGNWQSCDWVDYGGESFDFSPDGSRLLLVESQTDGFGPTSFAVVDADRGPQAGVTTIDLPDGTNSGAWADAESVWVAGAAEGSTDFSKGSFIALCGLDDRCRTVETLPDKVVLGQES